MNYKDIEIGKLTAILSLVKNGVEYSKISKDYNLTEEQLKKVLDSFCRDYKCNIEVDPGTGHREFKKINKVKENEQATEKHETQEIQGKNEFQEIPQQEETHIEHAYLLTRLKIIQDWCYQNNRLPSKEKSIVEEQYYNFLKKTQRGIIEGLKTAEDESTLKLYLEAFEIFIDINNTFNDKSKFLIYNSVINLKRWTEKTGFKPENIELTNESTREQKQEIQMYNTLVRLRHLCSSRYLPMPRKKYYDYVLNIVEKKNSKTDRAFLENLRKQLGVKKIELNPVEVEALKDVCSGKLINNVAMLIGWDLPKLYEFLNGFCEKYNCGLVFSNSGKKGQRIFEKKRSN